MTKGVENKVKSQDVAINIHQKKRAYDAVSF
jgi:hypothetical protein